MRRAVKGRTRGCISVYAKENGTDSDRIGITISHREGNSVVRHTFIRRMREIFRDYEKDPDKEKTGKDIVVVARNGAGNASYEELRALFRTGLK